MSLSFRDRGLRPLWIVLLAGLLWSNSLQAAQRAWVGAASTRYWSQSANWQGGIVPASGDSVLFPASQPGLLNTNDLNGLVLSQVTFSGSGYFIYGNSLTLTNSLSLTNATGTNSLFTALSLSSSGLAVSVSTNATLILGGQISGQGGVSKTGPGIVVYQFAGNNPYTGLTAVLEGVLALNVSGSSAFGGSLSIGQSLGTASPVVRLLQYSEIGESTVVTVNENGTLDLAGYNESFDSLAISGGTVLTGAGKLTLNSTSLPIALEASYRQSYVGGHLFFLSTNACAIEVGSDSLIDATLEGNCEVDVFGGGMLSLSQSNAFTGPLMILEGAVQVRNSYALGSTNYPVNVSAGASLDLAGSVGVTNKTVILNGGGMGWSWGALQAESNSTNTWAGPVALNGICSILPRSTNTILRLTGPVSGSGGVILPDSFGEAGTLLFEGSVTNTYSGGTRVEVGAMVLNRSSGSWSIPGNLLIANGAVRALRADQISKYSTLTVLAPGQWSMYDYQNVNSLQGNGTVWINSSTLQLGLAGGSSAFSGLLTGTTSLGSVLTAGSGDDFFSGTNTLAGSQLLWWGGTKSINGQWNNAPVCVQQGCGFFGAGSIYSLFVGPDAQQADSLTVGLNPSTPATLLCTNLTLETNSTFRVLLRGAQPGQGYGQLQLCGTNAIRDAFLAVQPLSGLLVKPGDQFCIINNTSAKPIAGQFNGLSNGASFSASGYRFQIRYDGGDGNDVVLTLLDTPTTASLASGLGSDGYFIGSDGCNMLWVGVSNKTDSIILGGRAYLSGSATQIESAVWVTQPYAEYPNIPPHICVTNQEAFQVATALRNCGETIDLQLTLQSASAGTFTIPFTAHTGQLGTNITTAVVSGNRSIPDIGTIESSNVVSSAGTIGKVQVGLWLTHTLIDDLSLWLIGPDGTTVPLALTNDLTGQNLGSGASPDAALTWFDDDATNVLAASYGPYLGSFQPVGSLEQFVGKSMTGEWRLRITDAFGGTLGTLRSWSLRFSVPNCGGSGPLCDTCQPRCTNAITTNDLVSYYRPLGSAPTSCGVCGVFPGKLYGPFHYNAYSFTNTSALEACVTATLDTSPWDAVNAAAYLQAYDTNNPATNYLGDSAFSTYSRGVTAFSFTVPAGAPFQVIVFEPIWNLGCTNYTLQLSGLPCPPPALEIAPAAELHKETLSWPSWAGDYLLEFSSSLAPAHWSSISDWKLQGQVPKIYGTNYTLTVPATNTTGFYRLRRP